jgi:succinate dehydrogenase / fumarate reductase cytochrome b subunit
MRISMSLFSSLGKKIFMGASGLMLCGFIVIHLIGNLTLLNPDRDPFNKYAHFLTQQTGNAIYVAEFMLATVFVIHFVYAIIIQIGNWCSRPSRYKKVTDQKGKSRKSLGSVTMIYTGITVLIFLVLHLLHFKFGKIVMYTPHGYDHEIRDLYAVVYSYFSDFWNVVFYTIVMILLGFHLSHGFWSAFQSLGLYGKRFTSVVYGIGSAFAIFMALGFVFLPTWIFMITGGTA